MTWPSNARAFGSTNGPETMDDLPPISAIPVGGGRLMDLAGKYLVVWLSPEAVETFLGVLEPSQERAMTTWTVAGQIVGEVGPGLGPAGALAQRRRDAAPRGAGLLPAVGAGHDRPVIRRAAGGRAADRIKRPVLRPI